MSSKETDPEEIPEALMPSLRRIGGWAHFLGVAMLLAAFLDIRSCALGSWEGWDALFAVIECLGGVLMGLAGFKLSSYAHGIKRSVRSRNMDHLLSALHPHWKFWRFWCVNVIITTIGFGAALILQILFPDVSE